MLAQERQTIILDMIRERSIIKNSDIVSLFGVSSLTARRDLDALQDRGIVRRVYGGAVLADQSVRQEKNTEALADGDLRTMRRAAMVREAIAMVREGDRIHLGNGVTVAEIARQLCRFRQLSIVTGSLAAASQLIGSGHEVFLLGGKLHHDERNLSGSYAIQMAKDFHVNIAFIPCGGVSAEYGVMSDYLPAAELGRVGFENAKKAVLVCSSERIGRVTMHAVCPVSTLDVIITDDGISAEQKEALEACGVEVVVARINDECSE